ncbi:sensor histidine kinase [Allosphingosinicella indica]|nr:histidine kinase [Allosphingosinicella indica]
MLGDSIAALRHKGAAMRPDTIIPRPSAKADARWREAIRLTVALWSFVLLIFMPAILRRHDAGGFGSILLDSATIFYSMLLGIALFIPFRATIDRPNRVRVAILLMSALAAAIANAIFDLVYTAIVADSFDETFASFALDFNRGYESAFRYLMVFVVNLALFQLAFSMRRTIGTERQLVEAHTTAQQAQLTALRYQLNPHFLFNALNSISALIVTKRNDDAEQMTDKLSSFLRSSLATDPAALVPLAEELSLIEEYLDIEAVRFGDRLNATVECEPDASEALVPGFLVQPLVENAIKHGVSRSKGTVDIDIRASVDHGDLCITVENDRVRDTTRPPGARAGVGLLNVRQRLQAVYGDSATLKIEGRADSFCATICIPEIQQRH